MRDWNAVFDKHATAGAALRGGFQVGRDLDMDALLADCSPLLGNELPEVTAAAKAHNVVTQEVSATRSNNPGFSGPSM